MDPLTAALNLANAAIVLATKIWDAMTPEQRTAAAGDWFTFTHNISSFITSVQEKINKAV